MRAPALRRPLLTAAFAVAVLAVVTACVQTQVTSVTNRAAVGDRQYARVMVGAKDMPLDEVLAVEAALAESLGDAGIEVVRRSVVLPPTENYTTEQLNAALKEHRVDGVLLIALGDRRIEETYVPPTYVPGTARRTVRTVGDTTYLDTDYRPGYFTGGYTLRSPNAVYNASFYDAPTSRRVWIASGKSSGSGGAGYVDLAKSMAAETVKKLQADGLLRMRAKMGA